MAIRKFEDLEIWEEARELCKVLYKITLKEPFSKDFKFKDQMRASAGSSMDHIAGGFDLRGIKNSLNLIYLERFSGEVSTQSYSACRIDVIFITYEKLDELLERTDSLSRNTWNLMEY